MRTLGIVAIAVALALALASLSFIGLAYTEGWSGPACNLAGGLCERPSLLLIPIVATLAWGFMVLRAK
jgi:hypothetical protein